VASGKSYWFRRKRYGWGWGLPTTWQGWVVFLLWFAVLLEGTYSLRHRHELPFRLAFILVMIIVLTLVCYWKGEPPEWRSSKQPE
jgi:uncharacterized membrane protein YhaH (DUF805 family)